MARIVIFLFISYFLGGAAAYAVFLLVAWSVGQLEYGIHSDAALVLLFALPVGWVGAFVLLYRSKLLAAT